MSEFYKDQRLTHLNKYEVYIWKKFLDKYKDDYFNYIYDVHLPVTIIPPEDLPEEYKKLATDLSAKRIDVTMQEKGITWIVEIRPNAKQGAVGQLILYRYLYILQFNPTNKIRLMLVTDYNNIELKMVCDTIGIIYKVL